MHVPINSKLKTDEQHRILDIGCGLKKNPGMIGLDILSLPGVDVVADAFHASLPFRSGVFSEILCFHVLEHSENLIRVMEEIHRVLRGGGVLHLISPHGGTLRFLGDPTHKTAITCSTFNYFMPEYPYNYYSKARFHVESIALEEDVSRSGKLWWRFVSWLWKKRMWQMERILTFFKIDFSLDVRLRKV